MKKYILSLSLIIATMIFFGSCKKDEQVNILTFEFEQPQSNEKVYITDGGVPVWHDRDTLRVNEATYVPINYTQSGQCYLNKSDLIFDRTVNNEVVHFDGTQHPYYITVLGTSAGCGKSSSGEVKGFAEIKRRHSFRKAPIFRGSTTLEEKVYAPMMGYIDDTNNHNFQMKNLSGILRFKLSANQAITVDSLRIDSDKPIAGNITCIWDIANNRPGSISLVNYPYNYTVLTNIKQSLSSTPTTICHIPLVPVANATLSFTIYCHDIFGKITYTRAQTNHTFSINRNDLITLQANLDDGNWQKDVVDNDYRPQECRYYFTVDNAGSKVEISTGNLQYNPSTKEYRFAEHQYDIIGTGNNNISATYDGWIDLFGFHAGNNAADATNNVVSTTNNNDYTGTFVEYRPANTGWRTPTISEFEYILSGRGQSYMCAFAKIRTDATPVEGLILFPDGFTPPSGIAINSINPGKNFTAATQNTYTSAQWTELENVGCVFLPHCGYRSGATTTISTNGARYWTSTGSGAGTNATSIELYQKRWNSAGSNKYLGRGVRLIRTCVPSTSSTKK